MIDKPDYLVEIPWIEWDQIPFDEKWDKLASGEFQLWNEIPYKDFGFIKD